MRFLPFVTTLVDLKGIVTSEINHIKTDTIWSLLHVNLKKKRKKKNKQALKYREQIGHCQNQELGEGEIGEWDKQVYLILKSNQIDISPPEHTYIHISEETKDMSKMTWPRPHRFELRSAGSQNPLLTTVHSRNYLHFRDKPTEAERKKSN